MGWFSRKAYRARFTGVASGILYEENGKRMLIDCERLSEPLGVLVYTATMKWQEPHSNEPVESEDIERIKTNIVASLGSFNIRWE
jgi:hypothetical protein